MIAEATKEAMTPNVAQRYNKLASWVEEGAAAAQVFTLAEKSKWDECAEAARRFLTTYPQSKLAGAVKRRAEDAERRLQSATSTPPAVP